MSKLDKNDVGQLVRVLRGADGELSIPKPFEREIFLFDTYIAGTGYVEEIEDLEPDLRLDDKVVFFREPNNPHDSRAILVKNMEGNKLGYLPRADNEVFSRLMDAGKLLFGRISAKEFEGDWLRIDIKVYLQD